MHVFQALLRMTPEAAKAMTYVAQFIRSTTARGDFLNVTGVQTIRRHCGLAASLLEFALWAPILR